MLLNLDGTVQFVSDNVANYLQHTPVCCAIFLCSAAEQHVSVFA